MPRDGSSVYHIPPGTEGAPDTVIESAKYNSYITDIEQDLNAPRPILAGGTGATSADAALAALSGEKAGQIVTNYDSHVFIAGSFSSASTATGAPAAEAFAGICYMADDNNYFIEARSFTSGNIYARGKVAGVWGVWVNSEAVLDNIKVNRAGDTMTGPLTVNANIMSAVTANTGTYHFGNSGTKSLAYDGTSFSLNGGALVAGQITVQAPTAGFSLTLKNSSVNLNKNFRVSAGGNLEIVNNANTGIIMTLGDTGVLTTASDIFGDNNITAGNDLRAVNTSYSSGAFGFRIDSVVGSGTVGVPYVCNVMNANPNFGTVTMETAHISGVWAGWQFTVASNVFQFRNDGSAQKSGAGTAWVVTSDARAKDIKGDYTQGLNAIAALRPVKFNYKRNQTEIYRPGRARGRNVNA